MNPENQNDEKAKDPLANIAHTSTAAENVTQEEKLVAALCYVPFGAFSKAMLAVENKNSKFVDFHFRRGTFTILAFLVIAMIVGALGITFLSMPFNLGGLGFLGYCGWQAYNGNYFEFTFVRNAMNTLVNFLK